jgi:hypothetical protein
LTVLPAKQDVSGKNNRRMADKAYQNCDLGILYPTARSDLVHLKKVSMSQRISYIRMISSSSRVMSVDKNS